jgi:hypothetical protein
MLAISADASGLSAVSGAGGMTPAISVGSVSLNEIVPERATVPGVGVWGRRNADDCAGGDSIGSADIHPLISNAANAAIIIYRTVEYG